MSYKPHVVYGQIKMNVVLDLGANIECNDQAVDFAELGSALFNISNEKPKYHF